MELSSGGSTSVRFAQSILYCGMRARNRGIWSHTDLHTDVLCWVGRDQQLTGMIMWANALNWPQSAGNFCFCFYVLVCRPFEKQEIDLPVSCWANNIITKFTIWSILYEYIAEPWRLVCGELVVAVIAASFWRGILLHVEQVVYTKNCVCHRLCRVPVTIVRMSSDQHNKCDKAESDKYIFAVRNKKPAAARHNASWRISILYV